MYITNDTEVALIAEKYGVERIWVDLEVLGKDIRQFTYNSVKSRHSVSDIAKIKSKMTKSKVLVRVNPWHTFPFEGYDDSANEINAVIEAGADLVMLPMWNTVEEVKKFLNVVNGRVKTVLLLETKEAEACLDELIAMYKEGSCKFDELYIGLNDLHISYGLDFMFELLSNGTVERICNKIRNIDVPYGFGGIAKIGDGAIPAEKILLEHYRLGSERVILSRTFCDNSVIDDIDEIDRVFKYNMRRIKDYEDKAAAYSFDMLLENKNELSSEIARVTVNIKKKKEQLQYHSVDKSNIFWDRSLKDYEPENSFYLLDTQQFENNFIELKKEFCKVYPHFNIAYSYKTNYIPVLCRAVNRLGGYAEVVSEIELEMALRCGVDASKIIWNGPVKDGNVVDRLLAMGGEVNVDTFEELKGIAKKISSVSNRLYNIGIRCNFDIGDGKISRFGIDINSTEFKDTVRMIKDHSFLRLKCLHCHFADRSIDYWPARVSNMLKVIDYAEKELGYVPSRIDFGGGIYGKMPEFLRNQFEEHIPTYSEYAECMRSFGERFRDYKPEIVIEPGSALVGDCMKYVARVESLKQVRGKYILTVMGSQKNICMDKVNPPIQVLHDRRKTAKKVEQCDIVGYTCIENDVLYRNYQGEVSVGDYIVFENCGSYSIVMKPPFIMGNCPVYEIRNNEVVSLIKRQEYFDDIFHTFIF